MEPRDGSDKARVVPRDPFEVERAIEEPRSSVLKRSALISFKRRPSLRQFDVNDHRDAKGVEG